MANTTLAKAAAAKAKTEEANRPAKISIDDIQELLGELRSVKAQSDPAAEARAEIVENVEELIQEFSTNLVQHVTIYGGYAMGADDHIGAEDLDAIARGLKALTTVRNGFVKAVNSIPDWELGFGEKPVELPDVPTDDDSANKLSLPDDLDDAL